MLSSSTAVTWLLLCAFGYAAAGILYTRRFKKGLEDYITARNSQSAVATILTLMASTLGAWILFAPAQAATWGGLAAIIGYALGAMSPRIAMIPLGRRMRELIPNGHSLTEFLIARYGRPMYGLALLIMVFYLFIAMSAEVTAVGKLVRLLAPVPIWLTAVIVVGATLIYTSYGGLRASIFTDRVHMIVIVPLLLFLVALGWYTVGGAMPTIEGLRTRAPRLLDLGDPEGVKAGFTFFVAILLTGLFHQGNWQRIYAARDSRTMRKGFLLGGLMVGPFIFLMGLFGLAFVGLAPGGDSSVALFSVLIPHASLWFAILLIPLGLGLVMSSSDTAISAVSSLIAVDLGRLLPNARSATMMRLARSLIFVLAIPVVLVAAQGFSVLYLFLLADLLCSAAAFPVFYGLFSKRHDGFSAMTGTLCGLAAGLSLFPMPGAKPEHLLESFLAAALVPVVVILIIRPLRRSMQEFDFAKLGASVRLLDQDGAS
ncbi:sodium:solute symporter [Candidimonas humi]|uniref:Sodium:solute symporter n=1 Tax=Candidimonas humi TaxID=683355 RepID=A0ABV8NUN5_9BURK|nr:sodium:solute symporter [Candidimonas humi]MBV6304877.1 sodium:solute symporter [Candidimonas humi]